MNQGLGKESGHFLANYDSFSKDKNHTVPELGLFPQGMSLFVARGIALHHKQALIGDFPLN